MTEKKVYTEGVFKLTDTGALVYLTSKDSKTVYLWLTPEQVVDLQRVLDKYLEECER